MTLKEKKEKFFKEWTEELNYGREWLSRIKTTESRAVYLFCNALPIILSNHRTVINYIDTRTGKFKPYTTIKIDYPIELYVGDVVQAIDSLNALIDNMKTYCELSLTEFPDIVQYNINFGFGLDVEKTRYKSIKIKFPNWMLLEEE